MNASALWASAFNSIVPVVNDILIPLFLVILAIIFVKDIVQMVINYRHGADIEVVPLVVLFVAIAILVAIKINPNLLWGFVGMSYNAG